MKTRFITLALTLFFIGQLNFGIAIENKTDSLEHLMFTKTGVEKANILNLLSECYWKENAVLSLNYARQALSIASDFSDSINLSDAYHNIGRYFYLKGDYNKSIEQYLLSLKISEDINYTRGIGKAHNSLGLAYWRLSELELSLENINTSLKCFREINDVDLLSSSINNLGIIYAENEEYAKALDKFKESYHLVQQTGNYQKMVARLNNLGYMYELMSEYPKALLYYNYSYRLADSIKSAWDMANVLINIGSINYKINKTQLAIQNLSLALEKSKKINSKELIRQSSHKLSEIYLDNKNYKKAYAFLQLYTSMKDSIFNETRNKQILELQEQYNSDKKENDIKLLRQENLIAELSLKKQKHFNYFVIALSLFFLSLLFIIVIISLNRKKINQLLEKQNKEISKQKDEILIRTTALENANTELNKLSVVASQTNNAVIILDTNYEIEYINPGFTKMYGFTLEELISERGKNLLEISGNQKIYQYLKKVLFEKQTIIYEAENTKKNGDKIWTQTTITPIIDADGNCEKLIAIDSDISKLKKAEKEILYQNKEIALQKKEITDSIIYSKRIQNAILTSKENIRQIIPESFTIYLPKEIIGGDFYWIRKIKNEIIVAVADCTGHGVPGALMSMLGITLFNDIVEKKGITQPGEVLNNLRDEIIRILHQKDDSGNNDGMDVALCTINVQNRTLKFAGANNPLIIANNKRVLELKPDKMPISLYYRKDIPFFTQEVELGSDDMVYMYSDGYVDQFGGSEGKKFFKSNLFKIIKEISQKSTDEQKIIFESTFYSWKGEEAQLDDVTMLGFRLPEIEK